MEASNGSGFSFRLKRARDGRPEDVSTLLEAFRNYLRFLGRDGLQGPLRTKVDASDIVQEVLLRAQGHFDQFRGGTEAELAAWLRAILAREIVRHARKHGGPPKERPVTELLYESAASLSNIGGITHSTPSQRALTVPTWVTRSPFWWR